MKTVLILKYMFVTSSALLLLCSCKSLPNEMQFVDAYHEIKGHYFPDEEEEPPEFTNRIDLKYGKLQLAVSPTSGRIINIAVTSKSKTVWINSAEEVEDAKEEGLPVDLGGMYVAGMTSTPWKILKSTEHELSMRGNGSGFNCTRTIKLLPHDAIRITSVFERTGNSANSNNMPEIIYNLREPQYLIYHCGKPFADTGIGCRDLYNGDKNDRTLLLSPNHQTVFFKRGNADKAGVATNGNWYASVMEHNVFIFERKISGGETVKNSYSFITEIKEDHYQLRMPLPIKELKQGERLILTEKIEIFYNPALSPFRMVQFLNQNYFKDDKLVANPKGK